MSNSKETMYISFNCSQCGTILVETRRKLSEEEVLIMLKDIREEHTRLHEKAYKFDGLKRELLRFTELVEDCYK